MTVSRVFEYYKVIRGEGTMDYRTIYQEILNGEAVLFLGAGFSIGNSCEGGLFKTGAELAHYLCDIVGNARTDNLNIACSKYLNHFADWDEGVLPLVKELKKQFMAKSICESHEWLLSLPWKRIYTTNYDNLAELASEKRKIKRKSFNILVDTEPTAVINSIIHINGSIKDTEGVKDYDSFENCLKITHESYFKDYFLESDWKSLFVDDLFGAKRVVFLGYSLDYDFSLQSMIIDEAKNKCIFIDYSEKDETNSDKAYRFDALGKYSFEGVKRFSEHLKEYEKEVFKQVLNKTMAFERISPESYPYSSLGTISGNEVFAFFVRGKFEAKFINTEDKVIIDRTSKIEEVQRALQDMSVRTLILHSKLGNGKSIFKHSLMNVLCTTNPVYELTSTENIYDEIEKIEIEAQSYKEYFIVIDDFGEFMYKLDVIYKKVSVKARFLLFVRTPIKDNLCNQLYRKKIVTLEEIEEIDLNKLDEKELPDVYRTFSTYGYWGRLGTINKDKHIRYYSTNCKREFANLSYFVLESEDVKKKISKILLAVKRKNDICEFLLADAILSKLGIKINSLHILQLLGINIKLFFREVKSPDLVEILNVKEQEVETLSPIFADYLLRDFDNDFILSIAAKIYINSSKMISGDIKYSIQKNLVSRSNIHLITNSGVGELDELAISFYDRLRESKVSKANPFYWLQYAISMLNQNKLDEAGRYFDNAFMVSKEFFSDPDLSHINTHYSRFLFEKEIQKKSFETFDFQKIRDIDSMLFVYNTNTGSNLKYCLRQIKYYKEIYDKYISGSNNAKWQLEYNGMLERIVKVSIQYLENSVRERYELDNQARKNICEMCGHFKDHVKEGLVCELTRALK